MEENFEQLEESTFGADILKFWVQLNCSWFKQIKQRRITSKFDHLIYCCSAYYSLPYSYHRKNDTFSLHQVEPVAAVRFIELLASLTLYHFSASSKETYYQCVDIRGLEFREIKTSRQPSGIYCNYVIGYDGMRVGHIFDWNFTNYYICHTVFEISLEMLVYYHWKLTIFEKKYKILKMSFIEELFNEHLTALCDAVFHPGVEIVYAVIAKNKKNVKKVSLEKLMELFCYCKDVKTFVIIFRMYRSTTFPAQVYKIVLEDDPNFLDVQKEIENWSTTTTRLEFFNLEYKGYMFQLHKNKLKRLVLLDGKRYWSDKCDIDDNLYKVYDSRKFERQIYHKHQNYLLFAHYDYVMSKLKKAALTATMDENL